MMPKLKKITKKNTRKITNFSNNSVYEYKFYDKGSESIDADKSNPG